MIKLRIFLLPSNRFLCQQRNIECEAFQFAIAIQTYDSKLIFRINPWLQPSRYWFKCRLQARILFLIYFDREMSIKLLFRSAFEKFFFHFPKEFSFSSLLKFFFCSLSCAINAIYSICACDVTWNSKVKYWENFRIVSEFEADKSRKKVFTIFYWIFSPSLKCVDDWLNDCFLMTSDIE